MVSNKWYLFLYLVTLLTVNQLSASIYCPPNKTLYCNDDRHYLPFTGTPTVFGYPQQLVKYVDDAQLDNCNTGYVYRRWYIDVNQDGIWQANEGSCIQTLYIQYTGTPIQVFFPPDKTYSCKEDIIKDKPEWIAGPCDVMGYSVKDDIFEVAPDACYKIMRTFTVINWCKYNSANPNGNNSGKWVHKQIIKVVENEAPVFNECKHLVFNTDADCKATVTLDKIAVDNNTCPSQLLNWVAEVDLWANGTVDYRYGFNQTGEFYIAPTVNASKISITLPGKVGVGNHKVYWSVRDQCGNFRSCNSTFEVKDQKAPTPYMHIFLTAAFRGDQMELMVPARIFNVNSFDNCTSQNKLRFSFSPDTNDTLRVVGCSNLGFQFYNIYVTDLNGNAASTEVFLLAFDNGSCNFTHDFQGRVTRSDGSPMDQVNVQLHRNDVLEMEAVSDENGSFGFEDVALMEDYFLNLSASESNVGEINIADFLRLRDYLLGLDSLRHFELIAADLDNDHKIRINDLRILRSILLEPDLHGESRSNWKFLADVHDEITERNMHLIKENPSLKSFDGSFDFTAVLSGDITAALQPESEWRSAYNIRLINKTNGISLVSDKDINLKGIQLELSADIEWVAQVQPTLNGHILSAQQFARDIQKGKLRIVLTDDRIVREGEEVLFLQNSLSHSSFSATGTNMLVSQNGTVHRLRLINDVTTEQSISFTPNPSNGNFKIIDAEIKIIGLYDLSGRSVDYSISDLQFSTPARPGIYILHGIKQGKAFSVKVVISH